ncbi:ABC transporter ATP-binding protein [Desulfoscipio gibsoniae]
MNIVIVQNLEKAYGNELAVNNVSFDIARGENWGLLGPNGAGKSTTISIIATLLKPTAGDVLVDGYSVTREPAHVQPLIGLVPQDVALYPSLTARENLFFFGRMHGLGGKKLRIRTDEVLEIVGLTEQAGKRIDTFSGGMKRRINIGIGLIHKPKLLILDEPTVGIDPQSRRHILDTVKHLNTEGMTVLYTSHYMEEVEYLCERVGIIDHGKLIAQGSREELIRLVGQQEQVDICIEGLNAETLNDLRHMPSIVELTYENNRLSIATTGASRILSTVLGKAECCGNRVKSVEIREPNLESVFLHLTGKGLRD